jgi:hypothetical protein
MDAGKRGLLAGVALIALVFAAGVLHPRDARQITIPEPKK